MMIANEQYDSHKFKVNNDNFNLPTAKYAFNYQIAWQMWTYLYGIKADGFTPQGLFPLTGGCQVEIWIVLI